MAREPGHYAIQSLDRAIDLLEAFDSGEDERGVADLARQLGLPRTTVHRILIALSHRGLIAHDERTGKYRLGLKLFELGSRVGDALDLKRVAHSHLVDLMARSGETTHLVVLDGAEIVFVDKVETDNPFRMVSQIGRRLPACFSGSGKALLSELTEGELLARFPSTEINLPQLQTQLQQIRQDGWAIDDQETQAGLRCVGTVVRDHTGRAIAGLSISGPIVRIGDERLLGLADLLRSTAGAISGALGYRSRS